MGCLKGANAQLPMPYNCGQFCKLRNGSTEKQPICGDDELQKGGCKHPVMWSAAGKALALRSQVWHLSVSVKEAALEQTLTFVRSFTLADVINTHLAGYRRTSWEERLLSAGAHQVWWWVVGGGQSGK